MPRRWLFRWTAMAWLVLGGIGARAAATDPPAGEIDKAFQRLYNTDFQGAFTRLDRYIAAEPADPLGYALRASAYLFQELVRLGVLEGEFFADDKRIIDKKKLKPDPEVRKKLFQAIADAQSRAKAILAKNPDDQNALFTMAVTNGIVTDYTALVEKRQISSLSTAKESNIFAQRLLKVNPHYYDAYLTTGFTEYLVGSLPFFVRWFVHFEDVKGSKNVGIQNLQTVARSGHYLRPFARILLAIVYLREKKPWETQKLLTELSSEYPENPLLHKELAKLNSQLNK